MYSNYTVCCYILCLLFAVTDARVQSDNEVMNLLVSMKKNMYEHMAQKANVEVLCVSNIRYTHL